VIRRRHTPLLLALCGALAAPAAAQANSGGAGFGAAAPGSGKASKGGPATTPAPTTGVTLGNGNTTVSASGGGITLRAGSSAVLSRNLTFTGTAPGQAGKVIEIERSGRQTHWRWADTVQATVAGDGSFTASWHTDHIGRFRIRATVLSGDTASSATVTPALTSTVYRPSKASWYGPGMYGTRTACGVKLTKATIGVANKTLPCGMRVAILYRGQTLTVPVIDHGPYVKGRDWDLTYATAQAFGIDGVATIDAVSLPTR
jgi:rare lipoprotein A